MQGALWTKELQSLYPRGKENESTSPHSTADTILRSTGSGHGLYSHAMERTTVNRDCYSWPLPPLHLAHLQSTFWNLPPCNSSQTFLVIGIACFNINPWNRAYYSTRSKKKKSTAKVPATFKNLLFYQGLMAAHSSVLVWRIPGRRGAWWAAVYGVAQSRTRLKRLSSSSRKY